MRCESGDVTSGRHSIVIFVWKDVDIRSHSQNYYFNFELLLLWLGCSRCRPWLAIRYGGFSLLGFLYSGVKDNNRVEVTSNL